MTAQMRNETDLISCNNSFRNVVLPMASVTPKSNTVENSTTGANAIPPKRGTAEWCIFRSSGMSNNDLRKAISSICGMRIPAQITLHKNTDTTLILQNII